MTIMELETRDHDDYSIYLHKEAPFIYCAEHTQIWTVHTNIKNGKGRGSHETVSLF